jgi:hypothetical protein
VTAGFGLKAFVMRGKPLKAIKDSVPDASFEDANTWGPIIIRLRRRSLNETESRFVDNHERLFQQHRSNPVAELRGERRQVLLRKRTPRRVAVASDVGHKRA